MKITSTALSLREFFENSNEQFLVPAYQRRYAWDYKQQIDLFNDLDFLPEGDNHLLGTVLCLSKPHTAGINSLELVDGQQRVTTITILMKVLARYFEREKDADSENADLAQELSMLLQCKGPDRKNQLKLRLGDLDRADYVHLMQDDDLSEDDLSEVENKLLRNAFVNFFDWVEDLSDESMAKVRKFARKLLDSAFIIRLDVVIAKDAYKLFETINNRGLPLKPTDIIKNFLLGHASSLSTRTLDKVKEDWSRLIIALDGHDTDKFFSQWLAGKLHRKVSKTRLVAEFKSYYFRHVKEAECMTEFMSASIKGDEDDDEDLEDVAVTGDEEETPEVSIKVKLTDFTKTLRQSAELYADLLNGKTQSGKVNRHLNNLWDIRAFPAFTWLLDMFGREHLNEKTCIRLLKALEAFMMRRHICGERTNELETIFAHLTGLPNENYEKAVLASLREYTPEDEEFESSFASFSFGAVISRARYALTMLEYQAIGHKSEYYLAAPDDLHVEHIIPQSADKFGDWPSYLGEGWKARHAKMVHRIGNMTLLADELNVEASNNPFKAKCKQYAQSNIQLTKDLVSLRRFKFKQVEDRSKEFARKAVALWKV